MGGNEGFDEYRNEGIPLQKNSLKSTNISNYDDVLGSEQFTAQFSVPSVIYYLQQEWLKQQNEKISFASEKSELKLRVSKLEGELKASIAQNKFLINRIQMLEEKLIKEGEKDFSQTPDVNSTVSKNVIQDYLPENYPSSSNISEILKSLQSRIKFVNDQISSLSQAFVIQTEISDHFKNFFKLPNNENSEIKAGDSNISTLNEDTSGSINSLLSVKEINSFDVDTSSYLEKFEDYKTSCDERKTVSCMRMRASIDIDDKKKNSCLSEFDFQKRTNLSGDSLIAVSDPPIVGFERAKPPLKQLKKSGPSNTGSSAMKMLSEEDDELIAYRRGSRYRSQAFRENTTKDESLSKHTVLTGHTSTIVGLCFLKTSECTVVSLSENGNICIHVCYQKGNIHQSICADIMFKDSTFIPVSCMASTFENMFYIGNNQGRISKWNAEDVLFHRNENQTLENLTPRFYTKYHRKPVISMVKSPTNSYFVCSLGDNTVSIWDCADDSNMPVNVLAPFFDDKEILIKSCFCPEDQSKLVLLTESKFELYDAEKEVLISHIKYEKDVTNLSFDAANSHHSSFYIGQKTDSRKGILVHGDLRSMSNLSTHEDECGVTSVICNLPDSNKIISGSLNNNAYLWDIRNWGKSENFSQFPTDLGGCGITILDYDPGSSALSLSGPGKNIHLFNYSDIKS